MSSGRSEKVDIKGFNNLVQDLPVELPYIPEVQRVVLTPEKPIVYLEMKRSEADLIMKTLDPNINYRITYIQETRDIPATENKK